MYSSYVHLLEAFVATTVNKVKTKPGTLRLPVIQMVRGEGKGGEGSVFVLEAKLIANTQY